MRFLFLLFQRFLTFEEGGRVGDARTEDAGDDQDAVLGGDVVELEVVLQPGQDASEGVRIARHLMARLGIVPES